MNETFTDPALALLDEDDLAAAVRLLRLVRGGVIKSIPADSVFAQTAADLERVGIATITRVAGNIEISIGGAK